jgi:imidazolonepropionase-like amidohydrolase
MPDARAIAISAFIGQGEKSAPTGGKRMRIGIGIAKLPLFVAAMAGLSCRGMALPQAGRGLEPPAERYSVLAADAPVALVNAVIIDGLGGPPIRGGCLVFRSGRIEALGPAKDLVLPAGCLEIDAAGGTVMPGIVNAHVHEAYDEGRASWFAYSGVTTVRDLHCDAGKLGAALAFRDRAAGDPRLCRIVSAGTLVTAPFGYLARAGLVAGSPEAARRKVGEELDAGVDFVKLAFQEPAFLRFGNLSPEAGAAAVAAAHARGIRVTAHVGTSRDLVKALDAGADDIAHIPSDELPDALIARMVESRVPLEGTLTNWAHAAKGERALVLSNYRRLAAAGAVLALGAEHIPSAGMRGPFAGMPIEEFRMMGEAGLSPMEIIVASTRRAAEVCGLGGELGTLEPGKAADILVLDGDPLEGLEAFGEPRLVVHAGRVIRGR